MDNRSTIRILLLCIEILGGAITLFFVGLPLWGNVFMSPPATQLVDQIPPTIVHGRRLIILEHADILQHDQELTPDIVTLSGSVRLRHGGWLMLCDSANLNERTNSFEAFGHVNIHEGDSITITANQMLYDGGSTLAKLRENVILTKGVTTLFTEELFYDRSQQVAYYENFGTLADSVNTLSSIYGEYNTSSSEALFQNEVHLENKNFSLDTEILHYNTKTSICRIISPTLIETTDSVTIETNRGFYNTNTEQGILLNRSLVTHPNGTLTGDSIQYDKRRQISQAYYNVEIDNQKDKVTYYGDYGYMDETNRYVYATGRAYVVDYSEPDTIYISADIMEGVNRKLPPIEHSTDSIDVKYTKGYHNVRLYRNDFQALGDSIRYFSVDSLIKLFGTPILWNDSTQLKGDTIHAHLANDTIDRAFAWNNASSVRWLNEEKQDRIKSDTIQAYFSKGKLDHAYYCSNVESRYYLLQDKTKNYYALAQVKNPQMDVYIVDDKIDRIFWHGKAEGTIHPIQDVTEELRNLSGAEWHGDRRPLSPWDVIPDRSSPPPSADSLPALMDQDSTMKAEFDGLAAWLAFDNEYQQAIQKTQQLKPVIATRVDSTTQSPQRHDPLSDLSDQLSIYIRRPSRSDITPELPPSDPSQSYTHLLPLYPWDSYLELDSHATSTISPFTGILRKSNSSNALSKSVSSSDLTNPRSISAPQRNSTT